MILFGVMYLIPFLYGTAYLVHSVKKRRLGAAFGMLLLLCTLVLTVVLLLVYRVRS